MNALLSYFIVSQSTITLSHPTANLHCRVATLACLASLLRHIRCPRGPTLTVRDAPLTHVFTARFLLVIRHAPAVRLSMHSKVFEAEWQQGELNPSKVLVDNILG
mgnify:CR=1 FL=1